MRRGFLKYSLLFFLLLQALSTATIRYVSKTGTSTPPFLSWSTASDSIQKCLNICNNGDTVIVANGVYRESLIIDSALTLIGSSMDSCIIDGTGLAISTITTRGFVKIHGFHIKGKGSAYENAVIYSLNRFFEISSCKLSESGIALSVMECIVKDVIMYDVQRGVETFCWYDDWIPRMENSVIYINNSQGPEGGWYDGFRGSPVLIGNVIICISGVGVGIDGLNAPKKMTILNNLVAGFDINIYALAESTIVINNIVRDYRLLTSPTASILGVSEKDIIVNNIICSNYIGVEFRSAPAKADYNIYYDNQTDVTSSIGIGEHDIFADPMFVKDTIAKSLQYDYHLQMFSPGIDAGDPNILDVDGSRSDIGMFGGPYGMAYTYKDLPPKTPGNFTVNFDTASGNILIKWKNYTEADFSHYNIYRSETQGFTPDSLNKIAETDTSVFSDTLLTPGRKVYFRVIAEDSAGNKSIPGPEISVELTDIGEHEIKITDEYQLYQNYPNPFNPKTTIPFSVKDRSKVRITVYDIKGEIVKELINREFEAGYYETEFSGENLTSGIYLYGIQITGTDRIPRLMTIKKMVYIK